MSLETTESHAYGEILLNWERSKPDFMLWVERVCGIVGEEYDFIDRAISDDNSVKNWIHYFNGDFDCVMDATIEYRDSLLAKETA